jgi:hypothetical protein
MICRAQEASDIHRGLTKKRSKRIVAEGKRSAGWTSVVTRAAPPEGPAAPHDSPLRSLGTNVGNPLLDPTQTQRVYLLTHCWCRNGMTPNLTRGVRVVDGDNPGRTQVFLGGAVPATRASEAP